MYVIFSRIFPYLGRFVYIAREHRSLATALHRPAWRPPLPSRARSVPVSLVAKPGVLRGELLSPGPLVPLREPGGARAGHRGALADGFLLLPRHDLLHDLAAAFYQPHAPRLWLIHLADALGVPLVLLCCHWPRPGASPSRSRRLGRRALLRDRPRGIRLLSDGRQPRLRRQHSRRQLRPACAPLARLPPTLRVLLFPLPLFLLLMLLLVFFHLALLPILPAPLARLAPAPVAAVAAGVALVAAAPLLTFGLGVAPPALHAATDC
mmetsp:Transcript_47090/g.120116  ORF Transcript_47090/g.120116 Transcript_47090/m.120116 type:complete len:265 (-) Transcript_47090:93-887(-)